MRSFILVLTAHPQEAEIRGDRSVPARPQANPGRRRRLGLRQR